MEAEVEFMDRNVKPKTFVESLDHGIPQVYPGVYVAVIILMTYQLHCCTVV